MSPVFRGGNNIKNNDDTMHEYFKKTETVEYHIYDRNDAYPVLISDNYFDAVAAFNGGDIVYERHTTSYSSEWTNNVSIVEYEWHNTWKE